MDPGGSRGPIPFKIYLNGGGGGNRLMFCATNKFSAVILDDFFDFHVSRMICAININQGTNHY